MGAALHKRSHKLRERAAAIPSKWHYKNLRLGRVEFFMKLTEMFAAEIKGSHSTGDPPWYITFTSSPYGAASI